ncbi:MAG: aspartate aminotransferase family protein [Acidimicrobiaceae bacterium]|nr:aspartate aminotransferase family protein [Acidimicrobiaceae bacterium]MYC40952.1 aspartate aminotransferase family protein [Acidimicrobiaceae bacterium]MYH88617.1 aspartate aminotransferase family protein [Acidimicrobiaceae bacterium]
MTPALLHPFASPAKAAGDYLSLVRGEGSRVFDADGKSYIDGLANLWLCQVGHGRREIVDAVTAQMSELECYNTFNPFTNPVADAAAESVRARSPHPDGRVFFGLGGSDAVDTALKLARMTMQRRGDTDRQVIIRREGGYHGTNMGGTSAQGIGLNRQGWGDLVPHFVEVPRNDIEAMARAFSDHGERIAAVMTEPVQGAGGVWPPPDGYLPALRRLCDLHGALLIFDEVICGFGRTGEWFGAQRFGVVPDMMTFAKGVTSGYQPLSGVIVSRALCAEMEDPDFILRTGYTYSGHPASCAAAIANIELIDSEGLLASATEIGAQLETGLNALAEDGTIESCRGNGAVWAAELGYDTMAVWNGLLDRGVIVRSMGTALGICPPLVITPGEVDTILDAISDSVAANLRAD